MMIRNLLIYFIKGSEKDLTWSVVIPRRKKKKEKENSYRKLPPVPYPSAVNSVLILSHSCQKLKSGFNGVAGKLFQR